MSVIAMRKAVVLALALAGCQRHDSHPADNTPPPTAPARAAPKPGDIVDAHGITVKFLDGGALELVGKDQWGAAFDTTYENIDFVRKALPVLDRSVTPDQAAALHALLAP